MDITATIREYIRETFGIGDDPDFTDDIHLFDYGFVDSLGAIEIVAFVEETFSIEITQRDLTLKPMNTVAEIAGVVAEKI
ncbi:MAG: acyl carrier protein [Oscillospiraceae bacterium]|jgi:D-alanine--poly(phosphoribitol) ligase subunit 2|nr:acyl carrier protein [Oscillospiraceae bacterium]